jgi:hypothetical protein
MTAGRFWVGDAATGDGVAFSIPTPHYGTIRRAEYEVRRDGRETGAHERVASIVYLRTDHLDRHNHQGVPLVHGAPIGHLAFTPDANGDILAVFAEGVGAEDFSVSDRMRQQIAKAKRHRAAWDLGDHLNAGFVRTSGAQNPCRSP